MKYKILYHMMKEVKASLTGGTPEEDAVRVELGVGGVAALTVNDIDRISGFLTRIPYGDLYRELRVRRDQLLFPPDSPPEADQSLYCKICFERKADVIIQPCKHLICGQDYRTLKERNAKCPVCRGQIQGWTSLVEGMKEREDFFRWRGGLKYIR